MNDRPVHVAFYLYSDICTDLKGLAIGLSYYNFVAIVVSEIKEFGKFSTDCYM